MIGARAFTFGSFLLVPERQLLLRGDCVVRIGGRALDLLTALVERPGEILSKVELIARAWPSTTVEDCNLKVNIAALRRVLDDDAGAARYIATVTGRGYRFVAPVEAGAAPGARLGKQRHDGASRKNSDADVRLEIVAYGHISDGAITLRLDEMFVLEPGRARVRRGLNPLPFAGPRRMLVIAEDGE
jgi:DNA-binding winged helix-turn-helix (wHTH) protein